METYNPWKNETRVKHFAFYDSVNEVGGGENLSCSHHAS